MTDTDLRLVPICASCIRGEGAECHTPGCGLWMRDVPPDGLQDVGATDAEAECDEIAGRLSMLLDELTDGLLSKPNYPVRTMVQQIEETFDRHAEADLAAACAEVADRDRRLAAVEAVRARWATAAGYHPLGPILADLRAALADAPSTLAEVRAQERNAVVDAVERRMPGYFFTDLRATQGGER